MVILKVKIASNYLWWNCSDWFSSNIYFLQDHHLLSMDCVEVQYCVKVMIPLNSYYNLLFMEVQAFTIEFDLFAVCNFNQSVI